MDQIRNYLILEDNEDDEVDLFNDIDLEDGLEAVKRYVYAVADFLENRCRIFCVRLFTFFDLTT